MAKKKTEFEQLLNNLMNAPKPSKKVIARLKEIFNQQEQRIEQQEQQLEQKTQRTEQLQEEIESIRQYYQQLLKQAVGANYENYLIGYDFEQYVVRWMDEYYDDKCDLITWQSDKSTISHVSHKRICAKWNSFPDLWYFDETKQKLIALECKYKSNGKLTIDAHKYKDYKDFTRFMRQNTKWDVQVHIMVGSRGTADDPDFMYCIPLDYFENHDYVDLRNVPQFKILEGNTYKRILTNNIPF